MLSPYMDDLHVQDDSSLNTPLLSSSSSPSLSLSNTTLNEINAAVALISSNDSYYAQYDQSYECKMYRLRTHLHQLYGTQSILQFVNLVFFCTFLLADERDLYDPDTASLSTYVIIYLQVFLMICRVLLDCSISVQSLFGVGRFVQMILSFQSLAYFIYIFSNDICLLLINTLLCVSYIPLAHVIYQMYKLLKKVLIKPTYKYECKEHVYASSNEQDCDQCICCICLESMHNNFVTTFPCSHSVHYDCFLQYNAQKTNRMGSNVCLVCRRPWVQSPHI